MWLPERTTLNLANSLKNSSLDILLIAAGAALSLQKLNSHDEGECLGGAQNDIQSQALPNCWILGVGSNPSFLCIMVICSFHRALQVKAGAPIVWTGRRMVRSYTILIHSSWVNKNVSLGVWCRSLANPALEKGLSYYYTELWPILGVWAHRLQSLWEKAELKGDISLSFE